MRFVLRAVLSYSLEQSVKRFLFWILVITVVLVCLCGAGGCTLYHYISDEQLRIINTKCEDHSGTVGLHVWGPQSAADNGILIRGNVIAVCGDGTTFELMGDGAPRYGGE